MISKKSSSKNYTKHYIIGAGIVAVTLVAIVSVMGIQARLPRTPLEAGQWFCTFTQTQNEAKLKHMLTPNLRAAWQDAEDKNDAAQKAAPDDKPPFGDGIPTQAYQDFAEGCTPGRIITQKDTTLIEIRHDFPNDKKNSWVDRLVLKQAATAWIIDDIQFAPKYRDTLRKTLAEAFK